MVFGPLLINVVAIKVVASLFLTSIYSETPQIKVSPELIKKQPNSGGAGEGGAPSKPAGGSSEGRELAPRGPQSSRDSYPDQNMNSFHPPMSGSQSSVQQSEPKPSHSPKRSRGASQPHNDQSRPAKSAPSFPSSHAPGSGRGGSSGSLSGGDGAQPSEETNEIEFSADDDKSNATRGVSVPSVVISPASEAPSASILDENGSEEGLAYSSEEEENTSDSLRNSPRIRRGFTHHFRDEHGSIEE